MKTTVLISLYIAAVGVFGITIYQHRIENGQTPGAIMADVSRTIDRALRRH